VLSKQLLPETNPSISKQLSNVRGPKLGMNTGLSEEKQLLQV
jgi:hypothetical protein